MGQTVRELERLKLELSGEQTKCVGLETKCDEAVGELAHAQNEIKEKDAIIVKMVKHNAELEKAGLEVASKEREVQELTAQ